ncbi:hypothetical protein BJ875DRAFT_479710 [Amylocarpus encephaloides]|uniref:Ankyrin repeat protein n=1 Tax=Amylocarpus encephaloides TaxID=45428 RepID=A0A9P7YT54_9HELO|nr:hypothetical protein BJ875DRAFT_479710 [Amylocarpus encephaloides]
MNHVYPESTARLPSIDMVNHVGISEESIRAKFESQKTKEEIKELNGQLSHAAYSSDFEAIKRCLDAGADINTTSATSETRKGEGGTPLWTVIYWNNQNSNEIAELLLDRGADFEIPDRDGDTPLGIAVDKANEENVRLCL